jgi:thiol-disulfide isomerase/thioredoxin
VNPSLTGLLVAVAAIAVATGFGLVWRAREGRVRPGSGGCAETLTGLGVEPGVPVTLLQFSSLYCAPCRSARAVCADLAATVPGVRHVEVDADLHLDAARELHVWRTPTVLVVDGRGRVVGRAVGAPSREDVLAAVAEVGSVPS